MIPTSRSIVITGASSGIGAALAAHFAGPGVRLLLIARNPERTDLIARRCAAQGAQVERALLDVRNTIALAERICGFDARGPVDLVIANAGAEASLGPDRTAEVLDACLAQIRINFEGAIATVTPLLEPMRQRRHGQIVLISSLAALTPLPDQPAYSAAKAGIAAWGDALRVWLKPAGVGVTIVYPGFVASGMAGPYIGSRPFEMSAGAAAAIIATGVARRRAVVAFPWPLVWLVRLGRIAPRRLRDLVLDRFFRFTIVA